MEQAESKDGEGASYTCFLFPFAYRLIRDPTPDRDEPCYVPLPADSAEGQQRRRYFTRETADAPFKWTYCLGIPPEDLEPEREAWRYPRRFKCADIPYIVPTTLRWTPLYCFA